MSSMQAQEYDPIATGLILQAFRLYISDPNPNARTKHKVMKRIQEIEFYLPQIVYLAACNKDERLSAFLLHICKEYMTTTQSLMHLPLQLSWLLEGLIHDNCPETYNQCVKLLMSIEAKVVNYWFEQKNWTNLIQEVPGLKEKILFKNEVPTKPVRPVTRLVTPGSTRIHSSTEEQGEEKSVLDTKERQVQRPYSSPPIDLPVSTSPSKESSKHPPLSEEEKSEKMEKLILRTQSLEVESINTNKTKNKPITKSNTVNDLNTLSGSPTKFCSIQPFFYLRRTRKKMQENGRYLRSKRKSYSNGLNPNDSDDMLLFHEERDFINLLTNISEKIRLIEPVTERPKYLKEELRALKIPENAYIPFRTGQSLGHHHILQVVPEEGIVFSTHSRAPCLICFEILQEIPALPIERTDKLPQSVEEKEIERGEKGPETERENKNENIQEKRTEMQTETQSRTLNGTSCVEQIKESEQQIRYIPVNRRDILDLLHQDGSAQILIEENEEENEEEKRTRKEKKTKSKQTNQEGEAREESEATEATSKLSEGDKISTIVDSLLVDNTTQEMEEKLFSSPMRLHTMKAYSQSMSKLLSELSSASNETWEDKKHRVQKKSCYGKQAGWNFVSLISKSHDDMRQEVFALQLIHKIKMILSNGGSPAYIHSYSIVSTGSSTGIIETINDAKALDSIKKTKGYTKLFDYFVQMYGPESSEPFKEAQLNFLYSLVGYSLVCYVLQIKDRHNGNILLHRDGHLIHIDFGFFLGHAPGGNWSIETAPYKLTKEMVNVLKGIKSKLFHTFIKEFTIGLILLQQHANELLFLVDIMMKYATNFPCFQGKDMKKEYIKLKQRLGIGLTMKEMTNLSNKLVKISYKNRWTKRYDKFQKLTNGIMP